MNRHKPIKWLPGLEIQVPRPRGGVWIFRLNWRDSGGIR